MTKAKTLAKYRTVTSALILLLLVGAFYLFYSWVPLARWISGSNEVSDLGVDIMQPAIVSMIYGLIEMFFSILVTAVVERSLREDSFGTWSRFGVVWAFCFFGYCMVAAAML